MRNEHDAEDVVQEASLRAFRYFRTFAGGDGRAWFLRIVRNTCAGWRGRRAAARTEVFDEQQHVSPTPTSDPESLLIRADRATAISRAMSKLPGRFQELLVLREFHGLSYRELADVTGIPIGTVMSRLSRAREALRCAFQQDGEPSRAPAGTDVGERAADPVPVVQAREADQRSVKAAGSGAEPRGHKGRDEGEYPDPAAQYVVVLEQLVPGMPEQIVPGEELERQRQCHPYAANDPCFAS
jgi:RNA polymerase sigma-70 factor (ECF subfamily)